MDWFEGFIQAINGTEITTASALYKLVVSLILGSAIGIERKRKGQVAGIRTFALISMGATLAMILSIYIPQAYLGLKNGDPGRVAAQVITGIGFLGAGAIIQMKGSVRGLTTAAGIWMSATIGMTVGVGLYVLSTGATVLVLLVLTLLDRIEHRIHIGAEARTIRIKVRGIVHHIEPYRKVLTSNDAILRNVYVEYEFDDEITRMNLLVLLKEQTDYISLFHALKEVHPTISISLANQVSI